MPLQATIPKKSDLAVVGSIFHAVLNNPVIGGYDFTNYAPAGTRVNVAVDTGLQLNPNFLYFYHQMNFSLSIEEGVFLRVIHPATVPELTLRDSSSMKNIFHAPFRMIKYFQNTAIDTFKLNLNTASRLIADFNCLLDQSVPELVGVNDIYAQVSLSVYEITDRDYINQFTGGKK
jgi:hypothetical protein